MPADRPRSLPRLVASAAGSAEADDPATLASALHASACLGAFVHDRPADRVRLGAPLARTLGLAPHEGMGLPLARFLARLHGEDRPRVEAMLAAARETGGLFEVEFRVGTPQGEGVLRLTGRAETGRDGGRVRTSGLAFDLTEMRLGRGSADLRARWQANQLATHLIAMKGLVAALGSPSLSHLLDRVAVETGSELARRLEQAGGGARR